MRRMIVLLTTVLLLGSASVAAAECGWVLWIKSNSSTVAMASPVTTQWEVESAFERRSDCVLLREKALERLERKLQEASGQEGTDILRIVRDIGESEVTFYYEAHPGQPAEYISTKYVCLPNTIDPREKK